MPEAKAMVPLIFWRRVKKARVLESPIIRERPIRKRICVLGEWVRIALVGFGCGTYISHGESGDGAVSLSDHMAMGQGTYRARSKNISTPPKRNSPPIPASQGLVQSR